MARLPRINIAHIPQHITQVGHNNLKCFFDDEDYEFYLESLKASSEQYEVDIHAYTLLPNATHIIATPHLNDSLPSMMQSLDRKSTRLNSSHVRISYAVFCLKKKKILTIIYI